MPLISPNFGSISPPPPREVWVVILLPPIS